MIHRRTNRRWLLVRQMFLVLGAVMAVVTRVAVSRVEVGLSAKTSRSE
jgi:hypothetical protein